MFRRILKITSNIIYCIIFFVVLAVGFFVLQNRLSGNALSVFGSRLYVVMSESMKPAIPMGSLAVVRTADAQDLKIKDVITYYNADIEKTITHRIIQINKEGGVLGFITKGDANDSADIDPVMKENVVGKVAFTIPVAGFLVYYAGTKNGIILLLILPGILIVIFELRKLFKYAIPSKIDKTAEKQADDSIEGGE